MKAIIKLSERTPVAVTKANTKEKIEKLCNAKNYGSKFVIAVGGHF